ncbi:TPA: hypothetical protein U9M81_001984 [Streptococcus agalactiae]|nr:hypothetical protein [Streptococcus agalactiae]HEO0916974.1 hypothetical protein [Streptococcus agalactiae]
MKITKATEITRTHNWRILIYGKPGNGKTYLTNYLQVNPKTGGHGILLEGSDGLYAKNRLDNRKVIEASKLFDFGDVEHETT